MYGFDDGDRLTEVTDPDSHYTLKYDDLDRLTSIDKHGNAADAACRLQTTPTMPSATVSRGKK